jgi:hypothetical protein
MVVFVFYSKCNLSSKTWFFFKNTNILKRRPFAKSQSLRRYSPAPGPIKVYIFSVRGTEFAEDWVTNKPTLYEPEKSFRRFSLFIKLNSNSWEKLGYLWLQLPSCYGWIQKVSLVWKTPPPPSQRARTAAILVYEVHGACQRNFWPI